MRTDPVRCVYCSNNLGMTQDHVPPKSFFPRPRPSDLITVPSCQQCNQGAGKEEEFFLATFMFSEAGSTPAGQQLWAEKLDRMYQKNLGLRKTIARVLSDKLVWTPTGLYLGRHMTIKIDHPRLERVAEKIVRGLYYHEYGTPLPSNAEIMTMFLHTNAKFHAAQPYFPELGVGTRMWPGIFEYSRNRLLGSPEKSMWLMRFYSWAYFWAITGDGATEPVDG